MKVEISPQGSGESVSYAGRFTTREKTELAKYTDEDREARLQSIVDEAVLTGRKVCVLGACGLRGELLRAEQEEVGFAVTCNVQECHRKPVLSAGGVVESEIARLTS